MDLNFFIFLFCHSHQLNALLAENFQMPWAGISRVTIFWKFLISWLFLENLSIFRPCCEKAQFFLICGVLWCEKISYGVVWCSVVWCEKMSCGVVWCSVVWFEKISSGVVWCSVVWCVKIFCGKMWCVNNSSELWNCERFVCNLELWTIRLKFGIVND